MEGYPYQYPGDQQTVTHGSMPAPAPTPTPASTHVSPMVCGSFIRHSPSSSPQAFCPSHTMLQLPPYPNQHLSYTPVYMQPPMHHQQHEQQQQLHPTPQLQQQQQHAPSQRMQHLQHLGQPQLQHAHQLQHPQLLPPQQLLHQHLQLQQQQHLGHKILLPAADVTPLVTMIRPSLMTTMTEPVTATTTSMTEANSQVSVAVNMEMTCVYRKFGEVIEAAGKIEATDEQVFNVFLQLSKKERKLVMAESSIRSFLSKCSYITVNGNTLSTTEPLPSKSQEPRPQETRPQEAIAQETRPQEAITQEAISQEAIAPEAIAPEAIAQEAIAPEAIAQEAIAQEAIAQEAIAQEARPQEAISQEAISQEAIAPEAIAQEAIAPEAIAQEAIAQETMHDALVVDKHVYHKSKESAGELCGISLDKDTRGEDVESLDSNSHISHCQPVDRCCWKDQMTNGIGAGVHGTKWSVATDEVTNNLITNQFVDTAHTDTFTALTYANDFQKRLSDSESSDKCDTHTFVDSVENTNVPGHFVDMRSVLKQLKETLFVKLSDPVDTMAKRLVYNAMYGAFMQVNNVKKTQGRSNENYILHADSQCEKGIQTEMLPRSNVMTNTSTRKDHGTQTYPQACYDVAINTVNSLFDRQFKYHLVPIVATRDACINTPEIPVHNIKSQCSVMCNDGCTLTLGDEIRQQTMSETKDSNFQTIAAVVRRDYEQSTDSTVDVSVQSSANSLKDAAYKKQPPGLPNIQQPEKKSKKAKAQKVKMPAAKAEVTPEESINSRPVNMATVRPSEATIQPIAVTPSHLLQPVRVEPEGHVMPVSPDPQLTIPTDTTVSTVTQHPMPDDPLLLNMMLMLEKANPALAANPQLLQMTAMNHMRILQNRQQQQVEPSPPTPVISNPQRTEMWQKQLQVWQLQHKQQLLWTSMHQPARDEQPESVAISEPTEPQQTPTDTSLSTLPQHWSSPSRATEQDATPTTSLKMKPSKQTEAPQRVTNKKHPTDVPADFSNRQKAVLPRQDDVTPQTRPPKVPGFLGQLPRKTAADTATTNMFSTSQNYENSDSNASSDITGGEDWDAEVDPYATTWTWGSAQTPEPAKEPPKQPIPGLVQKSSKKKATQDRNAAKVLQTPSTQPQPTQPPPTQVQTRPGNFFKKFPTPTLIPITHLSRDEAEPQMNLKDSSAFPCLHSHQQQKKAPGSSAVSELSDIFLNSAGNDSVSSLSDIPISSVTTPGFSAVAEFPLDESEGDMLEDFDLAKRTNWQPVVGKKKKGDQTDKQTNSFEKLIAKLKEMYPDASQAKLHDAIKQVRQKHAGLKGVPISQVVSDASKIIATARPAETVVREGGDASDPINRHNFKTRICQFWQNGICVQGDQCGFAHGKKELRQMARKTQMCQNILKGFCPYGSQCTFAHSEDELRKSKPPQMKAAPLPKVSRPMKAAETNPAPSKPLSWGGWSDTSGSRPTHVTGLDEEEDIECVICCDGIKSKDCKVLECGHMFHDKCIRQWVLGVGTRTCPTCRSHTLLVEDFPKLG